MIWWAAALLTTAQPSDGTGVEDGIVAAAAGNNARAVEIWTPLAKAGDPEANYRLAEAYQTGRGVPVDLVRARLLYSRAASWCHAPAQASLALLDIATGRRASALKLLQMASANNEPRALLFYGLALFNGDGVPLERERGYGMVKRAVALGLKDAEQTLSEMDVVMYVTPPQRAPQAAPAATPRVATRTPPPAPRTAAPARIRTPAPAAAISFPPALAPASTATSATGVWRIQLGAFRRPGAPQELFGSLSARLGGKQAYYPAQNGLTALQVGPYASRAEAQAACRAAGAAVCVPVRAR